MRRGRRASNLLLLGAAFALTFEVLEVERFLADNGWLPVCEAGRTGPPKS